ncbi:MAG: type II toxin-antitoxin system HicB family antitoxin [Gammaproteobacteria bacterium]|nr:type II toxin-antitoxin system HicB family antitoxin [Gammaproteobacteria bacterium]CAJ2375791.1 MAG: hypothetical protein IBGAMO2_120008 [Arenicellales bacterium IbO2]MDA7961147.1 type II toxin-antitoxin system HicB family antitoxin [Gammaproteobacteria bacterium]MDA7970687.1 type II toxin-antitoxin system HicB family antitoxin [Gammaproteobacteria bacterium]MDA7971788.1 type II toxin-antitoxin system HicB family antitoxin [Gammaproteobacteria bacterium]
MNEITLTQHPAGGGKNTISIKASLSATIVQKKPNLHVSHCSALGLYSQGETREEAEKNIIEAARLFIESCLERNTLNQALIECGFHNVNQPAMNRAAKKKKPKPAPRLTGNQWEINIPAELPVMVY